MSFELPKLEDLPIELKNGPAKPKGKDKKAIAQAQAFAKFGIQVIRMKARVLAALGKEAEQCGIKQIGHGKILLAADNAEQAITRLGDIVDKMMKENAPDYEIILEIVRLQREFNGQLIKAAEAHFNADKQFAPSSGMPNGGLTMPFPSGAAVMIGVGKAPSPEANEKS